MPLTASACEINKDNISFEIHLFRLVVSNRHKPKEGGQAFVYPDVRKDALISYLLKTPVMSPKEKHDASESSIERPCLTIEDCCTLFAADRSSKQFLLAILPDIKLLVEKNGVDWVGFHGIHLDKRYLKTFFNKSAYLPRVNETFMEKHRVKIDKIRRQYFEKVSWFDDWVNHLKSVKPALLKSAYIALKKRIRRWSFDNRSAIVETVNQCQAVQQKFAASVVRKRKAQPLSASEGNSFAKRRGSIQVQPEPQPQPFVAGDYQVFGFGTSIAGHNRAAESVATSSAIVYSQNSQINVCSAQSEEEPHAWQANRQKSC